MSLLQIENLNVSYIHAQGENQVIHDVSMTLDKNTTYGIIGESGSGKTTLMNAVLRLLNPKQTKVTGNVFFNSNDLLAMELEELNRIRWEDLSVVFQNSMNILSPAHRIEQQLRDIYLTHRPKTPKEVIDQRIIELFTLLHLDPIVRKHYPHELSGGMKQRVSIAMSLLFEPQLMILDEATTALDAITQNRILDELKKLQLDYDNSKLIITHDLSVVRQICENVFILKDGRLVEEGPVEQVFNTPSHPYTQQLVTDYQRLIQ